VSSSDLNHSTSWSTLRSISSRIGTILTGSHARGSS
jgi:hypothetical protein